MNKIAAEKKAAERATAIMAYFRSKPGEYVTAKDIATYALKRTNLDRSAVANWMRNHRDLLPGVTSHTARGYIYIPVKPVTPAPSATAKRTPSEEEVKLAAAVAEAAVAKAEEKKNAEGYSDPTAAKALRNTEEIVHFGEVWKTTTKLGQDEMILVLAATRGVITGLKLWPAKKDNWTMHIRVEYREKYYYTDLAELTWRYMSAINKYGKPLTKLDEKEREFLRRALGKYLHTTIVEERVIEKPVDKIRMIEKPVEKRVEVKVQDPELVKKVEELEELVDTLKGRVLFFESQCTSLSERNSSLEDQLKAKPTASDSSEVAILKAKLAVYEGLIERMFPVRKETAE